MYITEENAIYATRGDVVLLSVSAEDEGKRYTFVPGDVVRIKVYGKKDAGNVVLQKDFPVTDETSEVQIVLTEEDTKIGEVISKPKDYWYEVELNPFSFPQTIIGYDEDGPKLFRLFPEGADIPEYEYTEKDIPFMDTELDATSTRPVENQAVSRAVIAIEGKLNDVYNAVAELHVTPQMFGAVGDGVADDTEAFRAAIESGHSVHIPAGEYLVGEIVVDKNCVIYGDEKNKPTIKCRGIEMNETSLLKGLTILPAEGYEGTGVLVNKGGCEVRDCTIYSFNIGLELSPSVHIVGGVFKNNTIAYCKHAGVKSVASGTGQKNQILFEHLYIVKCGIDADNDTALSTKFENGFGMYLDGGYGIEVRNCVFEYNTGVGLYLDNTYPMCGCNVTSPYFEHNKYAQLYVSNAAGTYFKNVHISGDFYTDAGRSLPADAMTKRELVIENNGNLKTVDSNYGNYFSKETANAYGYANRFCPQNLFPYDVIGELCNTHIKFAEFKGERVWAIGKGGATGYGCPVFFEKGEYKVSFDVAHDGETTQNYIIGFSGHPDGSKTWTIGAGGEWTTIERDVSCTQSGSCYLYATNSNSNGTCYVRSIRITRK
jgi:hypothetical protein